MASACRDGFVALLAAVGVKRIGRDIEDAHDLRFVEGKQSSVAIDGIWFESHNQSLGLISGAERDTQVVAVR